MEHQRLYHVITTVFLFIVNKNRKHKQKYLPKGALLHILFIQILDNSKKFVHGSMKMQLDIRFFQGI